VAPRPMGQAFGALRQAVGRLLRQDGDGVQEGKTWPQKLADRLVRSFLPMVPHREEEDQVDYATKNLDDGALRPESELKEKLFGSTRRRSFPRRTASSSAVQADVCWRQRRGSMRSEASMVASHRARRCALDRVNAELAVAQARTFQAMYAMLWVSGGRKTATEKGREAQRRAGEYADWDFGDLVRERDELMSELCRLENKAVNDRHELHRLELACQQTRTRRALRRSHAESRREQRRRAPFVSRMSSIPEHEE